MNTTIKTFVMENKNKIIKKALIFIGSAGVVLGGLALVGKAKNGDLEGDSVDVLYDEDGGIHIVPAEESDTTEEEG